MPRPVITVQNLAKRYTLGNPLQHNTLRDHLAYGFSSLLGTLRGRHMPRAEQKEFWALQDLSFKVFEGQALGIIGHNGAGKSTLLKILSHITEPTHGEVRLRGRVASLLEVGTGFHPELSGRENIFMNGAILGMSRREIYSKFDEIVAFAEVEEFVETPVKRYSSGMYVRLAFAVAAHLEPEILVVDEVLAVGDMAFQKKCLGKMHQVARRGRTVLFVSHHMAAIQQLCDRCLLLDRGRLVMDASPPEVASAYLGAVADDISCRYVASDPTEEKNVVLLEAELIRTDGTPAGQLRFGEPFAIRMIWQHRCEVPGVSVSLRCHSALDQFLFAVNTIDRDVPLEAMGLHELVCRFNQNVLVPGKYELSIGSYIRPHTTLHERKPCLKFSVSDVSMDGHPAFNIQGGPLFAMPAKWEVC